MATRKLANTLATKDEENEVAILVPKPRLVGTRHLVSLRRLVHNIAASVFADSSFAIGMPPVQQRGGAELAPKHLLRGNRRAPRGEYTLAYLEEGPMAEAACSEGAYRHPTLRPPQPASVVYPDSCDFGHVAQAGTGADALVVKTGTALGGGGAVMRVERLSWSAHNPARRRLSGGRYTVGTLIWFDIDAIS